MQELWEKRLSGEVVFRGRIITARVDQVLLPGGRRTTREVVEHPGAVAIVAVTSSGKVLFVRQFRYAVGSELLEIPAGKVERGEDPAACARRELLEETGYEARELVPLAALYASPGFSNEVIHLFLARDLARQAAQPDGDEQIIVEEVDLGVAAGMVARGEFKDAKTVTGLLLAQRIIDFPVA